MYTFQQVLARWNFIHHILVRFEILYGLYLSTLNAIDYYNVTGYNMNLKLPYILPNSRKYPVIMFLLYIFLHLPQSKRTVCHAEIFMVSICTLMCCGQTHVSWYFIYAFQRHLCGRIWSTYMKYQIAKLPKYISIFKTFHDATFSFLEGKVLLRYFEHFCGSRPMHETRPLHICNNMMCNASKVCMLFSIIYAL